MQAENATAVKIETRLAERRAPQIQDRADQAVALRRRRLCHPMVALDHPLQQPRQRLRPAEGMRRSAARSAPMSISRSRPMTSATPSSTSKRTVARHSRSRRRLCRAGRRAVQPVSARARSRARSSAKPDVPVVIGGFHVSGCISMLPELTAGIAGGARRSASCSMPARAKAAWRTSCATWTSGTAQADLQLSERHARHGRRRRCRSCRARSSPASPGIMRASMPGAAARSSAASAPSSMCRAASRATAPPTTSKASCAPMPSRTSPASSSPTTISRATRTGSRSSTG